jgi:hypothetical protein
MPQQRFWLVSNKPRSASAERLEDNWESLVTLHYLPAPEQFVAWAGMADLDVVMESYRALRKKLLLWAADSLSTKTWADAEAYLTGIIRNKAQQKATARNQVIREI